MWVRHASRLVHGTVLREVTSALADLQWMSTNETDRPFGRLSAPVAMRDTRAIAGDRLETGVAAGTVACTLGDELPYDPEEMGGPLASQEYPIFFDVFQSTEATTLALATDIKDILLGRLPETRRFMPLLDLKHEPPTEVAGWQIELEDVERTTPDARLPLHWQVVKVTATAYYPEVLY